MGNVILVCWRTFVVPSLLSRVLVPTGGQGKGWERHYFQLSWMMLLILPSCKGKAL